METGTKAVIGSLKRARRNGQLNLIGLDLREFPREISKFSELVFEDNNWWELVPLSRLDLSNNAITSIPEELATQQDISLIRMQNNLLTSIPDCLSSLPQLKSIDLSKNKIAVIPSSITSCISLVELNLSENCIRQIPATFQTLSRLEILNLSKNLISTCPVFGQSSPLKRIDLSENKIERIPSAAFIGCSTLDSLILSKNLVSYIEATSFSPLTSLVSLFLDQNKLEEFSETPHSERLDQLVLSHNRIRSFNEFLNMPNLTALVLNNNKLTSLDKSILICKNLKTLDISNNDLPDIPSEIGLLPKLVRLSVEGNPLKCIRNTIKNAGADTLKKYLKDRIQGDFSNIEANLDSKSAFATKQVDPVEGILREFLRNNELNVPPKQLVSLADERFFRIPNLQQIDVTGNSLKMIPEEIATVAYRKTLLRLKVSNNQLEQLPLSLLQLEALTLLEAKQNCLCELFSAWNPSRSPGLLALQHLDLSVNKLRAIPAIILQGMPYLRVLNLAYNQVTDVNILFDTARRTLDKLEVVDISNNNVSDITENIGYSLPSLTFLNVENNNLSKIPTIIGFMKLKTIKIDGNPLKLINRNIIEKGPVAILDHLRQRHVGQPPRDLACMQVAQQITVQVVKPQENILATNDYQYRRQNHEYGRLNDFNNQPSGGGRPQQAAYESRMEVEEPPMYVAPTFQPAQMSRQERSQIEGEVNTIQTRISKAEKEISDNFSLNKYQITEKRREIQALKNERSRLMSLIQ